MMPSPSPRARTALATWFALLATLASFVVAPHASLAQTRPASEATTASAAAFDRPQQRVAVVGAGPVGLAVANRLRGMGYAVDVFEGRDQAQWATRGQELNASAPTIENLELATQGIGSDREGVVHWVDEYHGAEGDTVTHAPVARPNVTVPARPHEVTTVMRASNIASFRTGDMERALANRLERNGGRIVFGARVSGVQVDGGRVHIQTEGAGSANHTPPADGYASVFVADGGGRNTVRDQIGARVTTHGAIPAANGQFEDPNPGPTRNYYSERVLVRGPSGRDETVRVATQFAAGRIVITAELPDGLTFATPQERANYLWRTARRAGFPLPPRASNVLAPPLEFQSTMSRVDRMADDTGRVVLVGNSAFTGPVYAGRTFQEGLAGAMMSVEMVDRMLGVEREAVNRSHAGQGGRGAVTPSREVLARVHRDGRWTRALARTTGSILRQYDQVHAHLAHELGREAPRPGSTDQISLRPNPASRAQSLSARLQMRAAAPQRNAARGGIAAARVRTAQQQRLRVQSLTRARPTPARNPGPNGLGRRGLR